jgi:tetratricopeptide (TPR) repeat protein
MRQGLLAPLAALPLIALLAEPALAQSAPTPAPTAPAASAPAPAAPAPAAAPPAPATAGTTPGAPVAPRPPAGPSPYAALIAKGDGAYLARDFEAAVSAYRAELSKNASSGVAHYRLGEAQLAKGDTNEAEQSFQNALRFAGKDEKLRDKTLFVLADLRERLKAYDDAIQRWKDYTAHTQAQPEVKSYPATATERIKRIEEWKKISADAALVKERIEKRVKEAEESLRKSSK